MLRGKCYRKLDMKFRLICSISSAPQPDGYSQVTMLNVLVMVSEPTIFIGLQRHFTNLHGDIVLHLNNLRFFYKADIGIIAPQLDCD